MEQIIDSIVIKSPLYTISHFLIIVISLALGLLAYKRNPRNPNNRSFLLLNLSLALWAAITYAANLIKLPIDIQLLINRLTFSAGFILVIAFFNFCIVFPERNTQKTITFRLVALISLVLAIFAGFTDWLQVEQITASNITFMAKNPNIFRVFFSAYALFSIWALIVLHSKLRKLKGKKQTQVQYVFIAVFLFIIYIFSTNLVPTLFGRRFFIGHTALGALIFIGFTSYAVIRHRLMDIRLVAIKSAVYTALIGIIAAAYVFFVYYLKKYYEIFVNPDAVFIIATFAAAFGFQPLRRILQNNADKVFAKGRYNFQELLKALSNTISHSLSVDDLAKDLLTTITKELKISAGAFVLRDGYYKHFEIATSPQQVEAPRNDGHGGLAPQNDGLKRKEMQNLLSLSELNKTLVADELEDDSKRKSLMKKLGIEVIVFFPDEQNKAFGFIALSEKTSGEAYTDQDIKLIEIIVSQISIAIRNIEKQKEIIEQIIEERHRIDQDAHDKIYNRLGALAKKAEIALVSPEQSQETLSLLKDDLRLAVGDLQRIVSNEMEEAKLGSGLIDELKTICESFKKKSSIKIIYQLDNLNTQLDPQQSWHMQCILEECLNNIQKHSKATKVDISFQRVNGSHVLTVSDNGIGINSDKRREVRGEERMDGRKSGMGLTGMQERAKKINGEITMSSNNGSGTKVQLKIPIA